MKVEVTQRITLRWQDVPIPLRCENCPYPRVGFPCRDQDGSCLRTDMERLAERQKKARKRALSC